ncbi:MAG: PulJ/GspJ family protein [Candidatus Xenobia bacterium]
MKRGFTLVETAIYTMLLSLALTAIYSVLSAGLHYFTTTRVGTDLEQGCLRTLTDLEAELVESDAGTVSIGVATPGISFASPRDGLGQITFFWGGMQWQKFVCYYVNNVGQLVRVESAITPTIAVPFNQVSSYTPDLMAGRKLASRLLAEDVTSFSASVTGHQVSLCMTSSGRDANRVVVADAAGNAINAVQVSNAGVLLRN